MPGRGAVDRSRRLQIRTAQVLDWSNDPIIEFSWLAMPSVEA
jgi:hypothetical protein